MIGFVILGLFLLLVLTFRIRAEYLTIFIVGYFLRLLFFIADLTSLFPVFGSGADSEQFNFIAIQNVNYGSDIHLTNYSDFLTFLYSFTDCSRPLAQMINLYFGMGVLWIAAKTVDYLRLPLSRCKTALWIIAILPSLGGFSAILLREAWIEFFVAFSIYQFVKWYVEGYFYYQITSIISACLGAYMHDGVVGLIGGYLIIFLIYSPIEKRIILTPTKILIVGLIFTGILFFSSSFLNDKSQVLFDEDSTSEDTFLKLTNYEDDGNSSYLTWLPQTDNPVIALLFFPLKLIYLLFSPLPTEWGRFVDIEAFLIDSLFYLVMAWVIIRYKAYTKYRILKRSLILSVLSALFLYSYGTYNAGTALRHRAKFVEPISIIFALSTRKTSKE